MPVKRKPRTYNSELRSAAAEETRARIVASARAVFAAGEVAFSLDGVARHAGVTRLTVYNQFESRRGLLEAVFDDMAEEGGLFGLPSVLAHSDPDEALRRFVTVFCRFWNQYGSVVPRFAAVAKLDDEIAESLRERTERRRMGLTALVRRLDISAASAQADLVDILFALTSFEFYEALNVRNRSVKTIERLTQRLVADTVAHFRARAEHGGE